MNEQENANLTERAMHTPFYNWKVTKDDPVQYKDVNSRGLTFVFGVVRRTTNKEMDSPLNKNVAVYQKSGENADYVIVSRAANNPNDLRIYEITNESYGEIGAPQDAMDFLRRIIEMADDYGMVRDVKEYADFGNTGEVIETAGGMLNGFFSWMGKKQETNTPTNSTITEHLTAMGKASGAGVGNAADAIHDAIHGGAGQGSLGEQMVKLQKAAKVAAPQASFTSNLASSALNEAGKHFNNLTAKHQAGNTDITAAPQNIVKGAQASTAREQKGYDKAAASATKDNEKTIGNLMKYGTDVYKHNTPSGNKYMDKTMADNKNFSNENIAKTKADASMFNADVDAGVKTNTTQMNVNAKRDISKDTNTTAIKKTEMQVGSAENRTKNTNDTAIKKTEMQKGILTPGQATDKGVASATSEIAYSETIINHKSSNRNKPNTRQPVNLSAASGIDGGSGPTAYPTRGIYSGTPPANNTGKPSKNVNVVGKTGNNNKMQKGAVKQPKPKSGVPTTRIKKY
jgi:hypothetical protein